MALFQPTNIIPSSFTVGVVDADKDIAQVSWQVNGNSPMTSFRIDFAEIGGRETLSTYEIAVGNGGFYGTDRFGQPKMYTWAAHNVWSAYRPFFKNDKQYKMTITQYWKENGVKKSVAQIEPSIFVTRSQPSITIQRSPNANFTDLEELSDGAVLPSSIGYFVGNYTQAQGAPVREVRWRVATWLNGEVGEIFADTGNIDTQTLQYSFDGFFVGNSYAIRCSGSADYQTYGTQEFDSGWKNFTISTEDTGEYAGNFSVSYLNKENATLLNWETSNLIPPTFTGGQPTIENGAVPLTAEQKITWNYEEVYSKETGGNERVDMNYTPPWAVALKIEPERETWSATTLVRGTTDSVNRDMKAYNTEPRDSEYTAGIYKSTFIISPSSPYVKAALSSTSKVIPGSVTSSNGKIYSFRSSTNGVDVEIITYSDFKPIYVTITDVIFTSYSYTRTIEAPGTITTVSWARADGLLYPYYIQQTRDANDTNSHTLKITLYGQSVGSAVGLNVYFKFVVLTTTGTFLTIAEKSGTAPITVTLSSAGVVEVLQSGTKSPLATLQAYTTSPKLVFVVSKLFYTIDYIDTPGPGRTQLSAMAYSQPAISAVTIQGGDNGVTVDAVSVYNGDTTSAAVNRYEADEDFEPVWNDSAYTLYMSANFSDGIFDGGIGTSLSLGFKIYRQESGSSVLTPIATLPATTTTFKDFGIRSRTSYKYSLYAYDSKQKFMQSMESDTVISTCFNCYSLLVCDYDGENDAYHVRKQYLFALNLSEGSVGNNNSPTLNANFTAYPTRMPSTQNYASGTLQGLIGVIYTVPALVEQIGGFKHTAKPSTLDYFDSVDLEKELYDLSVSPYQLFLRDMKGHLRMVATNGAITMTQDLKKWQLSTSISLPWVEVGDASNVAIIQTPDDYGWNNDEQVLDVRLDVDPTTGILTATYPKPYNGTKFYLTGADKEILGAETPLGVTPAQFALSAAAKEPDDGTLTATAKVNTEEGD